MAHSASWLPCSALSWLSWLSWFVDVCQWLIQHQYLKQNAWNNTSETMLKPIWVWNDVKIAYAKNVKLCYTQTWNSVHFPKQHINCMGRYAFRKSVQSVQKIVKQHGDAIPNMLLSMCSNNDFYQFISSKQHGDAWLKKFRHIWDLSIRKCKTQWDAHH